MFDVKIGKITGGGLIRVVTALVTNTGKKDAHNVWAKVEVVCAGSKLRVGGRESLRVDAGTVKAGATVSREAVLQVGLFDGMKVSQNGAKIVLTVNSDELTQTFDYEFKP
ncbi:MAG: hypothetical protein Q7T05_04200 [Dehalococcoidia bacterium]|nr:hypothetical protein [Dehalococcoidia bacterium]